MTVLVTGGAGFIGSHVVDRLVAAGRAVTVLDNLDPQVHGAAPRPRFLEAHVAAGAVRFLQGDVTDPGAVEAALSGAEAVVHLAATVGVGQSMYQPDYYVRANSLGTGVLLQALVSARGRIRRLVVASSMSIYGEGAYRCPSCGGEEGLPRDDAQLARGEWEVRCRACGGPMEPLPTPERKPPDIASVYAATKKNQEDLCVAFGAAYGIPTFALRFFNVYGPRQSLSNPYTGVAAIFLSRLINGRPPLVFEDGRQSRDFIEVRDVARAVQAALDADRGGAHVLNVCTGRPMTVVGVAQALGQALGTRIEAERLGKYRAGDVRHCFGDPSRAADVVGFRAERRFAEALPDLVAWCRNESAVDSVESSLDELRRAGLVR